MLISGLCAHILMFCKLNKSDIQCIFKLTKVGHQWDSNYGTTLYRAKEKVPTSKNNFLTFIIKLTIQRNDFGQNGRFHLKGKIFHFNCSLNLEIVPQYGR